MQEEKSELASIANAVPISNLASKPVISQAQNQVQCRAIDPVAVAQVPQPQERSKQNFGKQPQKVPDMPISQQALPAEDVYMVRKISSTTTLAPCELFSPQKPIPKTPKPVSVSKHLSTKKYQRLTPDSPKSRKKTPAKFIPTDLRPSFAAVDAAGELEKVVKTAEEFYKLAKSAKQKCEFYQKLSQAASSSKPEQKYRYIETLRGYLSEFKDKAHNKDGYVVFTFTLFTS